MTYDLTVTNPDGVTVGYYAYTKADNPVSVSLKSPQLTGAVTDVAGQAGGIYTLRDQSQPALVLNDWSQGGGQKSYETEGALSSRFYDSRYIDTRMKGELRLSRGATLTADTTVYGFALYALDKVWMTFHQASPDDSLKYWDGSAWQAIAFTGGDPGQEIACLATDGQKIYAGCGSAGIYYYPDGSTKLAAWDNVTGITHMCFSGGYMYGAKATAVGYWDSNPNWVQTSPTFVAPTLSTIGLVTSGNWVYWGTTNGGVTRLYRTQYDGTNAWFEDVCDFPTGFEATCMTSYLNRVYVGGYYTCATTGVGQGALYMISDGTPYLLTTIGDNPDYTASPADTDNDNRIQSLSPSGKDLYILTSRRVYRWDLDDGGYVHVTDVPQGTASSFTWITTDDLDYEGTAAPSTGWTASGSGTVTSSGGVTTIVTTAGNAKNYAAAPTGGDALSNTTGTLMEVDIPVGGLTGDAGIFGFDDGTYVTKVRLREQLATKKGGSPASRWYWALGEWDGSAWDYPVEYSMGASEVTATKTFRLICQGKWAALYFDDNLYHTTTSLETTSGTNSVFFGGGWSGGTGGGTIKYDRVHFSDDGAFAPGAEYTPSTSGNIIAVDKIYVGLHGVGYVIGDDDYETEGWLRASTSSQKSGSIPKYYRRIEVDHDPLPTGTSLALDWYLDGVRETGETGEVTSTTKTTFYVSSEGYNLSPVLKFTSDGGDTPIVRSITVIYDFVRSLQHTFVLDCRKGAEDGRWRFDSEDAINHLIDISTTGGTFESRIGGSFTGTVESLDFLEANRSTRGGIEGIIQVVVKEKI